MTHGDVKLLIVDDHPVFRRGLREIIEEHARFKIIGEAGDGESGLRLAVAVIPISRSWTLTCPGKADSTWHER